LIFFGIFWYFRRFVVCPRASPLVAPSKKVIGLNFVWPFW
jgi:hypothetical protein